MHKQIILLAGFLLLLLTLTSCDISWTAGTPVSPCHSQDINQGYFTNPVTRWDVTVIGQPDNTTTPSNPWLVKQNVTPRKNTKYQYAGYEYLVLFVDVQNHAMSVKYLQSC